MQTSSSNNQIDSYAGIKNELVGRYSARWRFLFVGAIRKVSPNRKLYECLPLANDMSILASLLVISLSMINLGISIYNLSWLVSMPLLAGVFWARKNGKLGGNGLFLFWGFCAAVVNVNAALTIRAPLLILTCAVVVIGIRQGKMIKDRFAAKPFRLDNINIGSAKILVGRIEVLNLFVESSDSNRRWNPRNRKQSLRETRNALKWLTLQAKEYEVELSFRSQTLFPASDFDSTVPESDNPVCDHKAFQSWIDEALLNELSASRFKGLRSHSNIILLVHSNKELRSYAVPHRQFTESKCQIEYTVISHPPYSQTIAHEILHLFGADDFYMEAWGRTEDDGERSKKLRGKIMFETSPLLSDLEIDIQTAEKIGWR